MVSASKLDLVDVTMRALLHEQGEHHFDWLSVALQKWEQKNCMKLWILSRKSETFLMEHHLERKFNISVNSMPSEGERDLVFHSEVRVSKFDV